MSRRSKAKPANLLLGRLAVEQAPGALAGLADHLTVLLPWGSLLRAVALPDPTLLCRLHQMCRPGAAVRILFGYAEGADGAAMRTLSLPPLDAANAGALTDRYREAGFALTARPLSSDDVRLLPTTWARRLASSSHDRRFLEMSGHAAAGPPTAGMPRSQAST